MKEYTFKINGTDYNVTIHSIEGNIANVSVNGVSYQVDMGKAPTAQPAAAPASAPVVAPVATPATTPAEKPAAPAAQTGSSTAINSPLPGVIIEINVKEGQTVKAGEKVAVLEAMKMENEIQAEKAGTITKIHVNKGDSVLEGAPIVTIA